MYKYIMYYIIDDDQIKVGLTYITLYLKYLNVIIC